MNMVFSLGPGHGLPVRLPQWVAIRAYGPGSAQVKIRSGWPTRGVVRY